MLRKWHRSADEGAVTGHRWAINSMTHDREYRPWGQDARPLAARDCEEDGALIMEDLVQAYRVDLKWVRSICGISR